MGEEWRVWAHVGACDGAALSFWEPPTLALTGQLDTGPGLSLRGLTCGQRRSIAATMAMISGPMPS